MDNNKIWCKVKGTANVERFLADCRAAGVQRAFGWYIKRDGGAGVSEK